MAALVLLTALTGCGHQDQPVDATTTTAQPPGRAATAPTALTRRAWSARHPAELPVVVDHGYVVIADEHGVSVRNADTGHERWHYRDPRHTLVRADQGRHQVVAGGQHVLVRYRARGGQLIRVFDLRTGKLRRSLSTSSTRDAALLDGSRLYLVAGADTDVAAGSHPSAPVWAVDLAGGHREWSATPRCPDGTPATGLSPWLTPDALVVAGSCGETGRSSTVTALSPGTGKARWHVDAAGHAADRMVDGGPALLTAGAPLVLVDSSSHRYTIVDTGTGHSTSVSARAADDDRQPVTVADRWCTLALDVPVACFDAGGRPSWQRALPGASGTDRQPVGLAAGQPAAAPGVLALVTDSRVVRDGTTRDSLDVELLRTDTGRPVGAAHRLPGTVTRHGSRAHRPVLHAYGAAGLFVSTCVGGTDTATLTAYR